MRPRAINVKPLNDYKLLITFNNNETKIFDVKPYLKYNALFHDMLFAQHLF